MVSSSTKVAASTRTGEARVTKEEHFVLDPPNVVHVELFLDECFQSSARVELLICAISANARKEFPAIYIRLFGKAALEACKFGLLHDGYLLNES